MKFNKIILRKKFNLTDKYCTLNLQKTSSNLANIVSWCFTSTEQYTPFYWAHLRQSAIYIQNVSITSNKGNMFDIILNSALEKWYRKYVTCCYYTAKMNAFQVSWYLDFFLSRYTSSQPYHWFNEIDFGQRK